MTVVLALARTDCERAGSGLFAQPVNTVSSFVFLLVGGWIVLHSRRTLGHRVELAVFGTAVASNTVGGLLFHGLQWPGSLWVHDVCILSVLVFIVVFDVARFGDHTVSWTVKVFVVSLAALGLLLGLVPAATDALSVVLGVAVGVWEFAEYRHELPMIRSEGLSARRLARLGALAALALGATAFLVGRTGGWLCSPTSAFQFHAVWHVLAAAAMGLYAYGAISPEVPSRAALPRRTPP